eukprot:365625-Chlamydomonas_euryale.AAC.18
MQMLHHVWRWALPTTQANTVKADAPPRLNMGAANHTPIHTRPGAASVVWPHGAAQRGAASVVWPHGMAQHSVASTVWLSAVWPASVAAT